MPDPLEVPSISVPRPKTPGGKVSPWHTIAATRQMAVLVKSGIPLVKSLEVVSDQSESPVLARVMEVVGLDVEAGASFSEALGRHPRIFSDLYVNSIAAGETGGVMELVLQRLAQTLESDHELALEVQTALQYPKMVGIALGGAILALMTFVVPRFAQIYASFKTTLPLPTRVLIGLSGFLRHGWFLWVPALAGLFFALRMALRNPAGRAGWDAWKLKLPVFGPLAQKVVMTRFCSTLGSLYTVGIPIVQALGVASKTVGNVVVAAEIERAQQHVKEGKTLAGALEGRPFFPPIVSRMIAVGETSGNLPEMLQSLIGYYEREVHHTLKRMTSMIEPLMIAAAAVVVLGVALAIFLPLWNLIQVFKHR